MLDGPVQQSCIRRPCLTLWRDIGIQILMRVGHYSIDSLTFPVRSCHFNCSPRQCVYNSSGSSEELLDWTHAHASRNFSKLLATSGKVPAWRWPPFVPREGEERPAVTAVAGFSQQLSSPPYGTDGSFRMPFRTAPFSGRVTAFLTELSNSG